MKYILYIIISGELNKIALIKMLRHVTLLGLRESKDFVEQHILPKAELSDRFSLLLTEGQLGSYLIAERLAAAKGFSFATGCQIAHIEEAPEPQFIDISNL